MPAPDAQPSLFALPPREIEPSPRRPEDEATAARLSPGIRLGTMSWSYPGWAGLVYGAQVAPKHLAEHGLTAYSKHPLLRAVEIDRTYYEPLPAAELAAFAAQTPDDFRFVVKAHEECVVYRFPTHARYGKKRGEMNPRYLDAAYATDAVVGPLVEGMGAKLGALLLQFPPQDVGEAPEAFAEHLHAFLGRLPTGVTYAVELRNAELFTPEYAAALADVGAVHCHNVWPGMPPALAQVKRVPPRARRPLVFRWLMREGDDYTSAGARYSPFNRLMSEDLANRAVLADTVARAAQHDVPVIVLVDNKAEGCAPESVVRLARAIADHLAPAPVVVTRSVTS